MGLLTVKEAGWLDEPTEMMSSTQMLTQVSPGPRDELCPSVRITQLLQKAAE